MGEEVRMSSLGGQLPYYQRKKKAADLTQVELGILALAAETDCNLLLMKVLTESSTVDYS